MSKWILRRLIICLLTLFAVFLIIFLLLQALPGDAFLSEKGMPAETYNALRNHWKLNDSLFEQFKHYLKSLWSFDFGYSMSFPDRTVTSIIQNGLQTSSVLGILSLLVTVIAGTSGAVLSAYYEKSAASLIGCTLALSIPGFFIGAILQYFFGYQLDLLPIARWGTWQQTILPVAALAIPSTAFLWKLLTVRIQSEWKEPYVRLAISKGAPKHKILLKHILRNAVAPSLGYLGPLFANIATGSFVVEKIFALPGLGHWYVTAVANRDYPLVIALTILYCVALATCMLVGDLLSAWADPRFRSNMRTFDIRARKGTI